MKPMKLKSEKGFEITLFQVTDVIGKDCGVYAYHVIDEDGRVVAFTQEDIANYKFDSFVEIK